MDVFYPTTDELAKKAKEEIDKVGSQSSESNKYSVVRANSDEVYLIKDNEKHWVTNPEVYSLLGFKFGEETNISPSDLANHKTGEAITKLNYQTYIKPKEEVTIPTEPVIEELVPPLNRTTEEQPQSSV